MLLKVLYFWRNDDTRLLVKMASALLDALILFLRFSLTLVVLGAMSTEILGEFSIRAL